MDVLPAWASQLGVIPLVALFGWLIAAGHLVPGRTVQRLLAQADKIIASKQETIDTLMRQNESLIQGNMATVHTIESIRQAVVHTTAADGDGTVPHDG
jgi:hypothetical protein